MFGAAWKLSPLLLLPLPYIEERIFNYQYISYLPRKTAVSYYVSYKQNKLSFAMILSDFVHPEVNAVFMKTSISITSSLTT